MAKTVMIPASEQEMWVCRINHKEYSYPQGTQQSVPDEVAELIAAINANAVQTNAEPKKDWAVYSVGGWMEIEALPDTTSASAGDVLSLDEDKEPVWSTPSGGGGEIVRGVYNSQNSTVYFTELGSETHLTMTEVFEKLEGGAFMDGDAGLSKFSKMEYQSTEYMVGYCVFLVASASQCRWVNMAIAKSNDTSLDVSEQDQFIWSIEEPAQ